MKEHYIGKSEFNVYVPDLLLSERNDDSYDSRRIRGIMTSDRKDRQDEVVVSKGLDFSDFLKNGHFNDNHSQSTSGILGYPQDTKFYKDLGEFSSVLKGSSGWVCEGYILKGTKRSDGVWELAKALANVPDKKLGFSIEGKVSRRSDGCIEKASIRNVAITNCPVNTDATWNVLSKSFNDPEIALKALSAGYADGVSSQSDGSALRVESLDTKEKKEIEEKELERALKDVLGFDKLIKSMQYCMNYSEKFDKKSSAILIKHLLINERNL